MTHPTVQGAGDAEQRGAEGGWQQLRHRECLRVWRGQQVATEGGQEGRCPQKLQDYHDLSPDPHCRAAGHIQELQEAAGKNVQMCVCLSVCDCDCVSNIFRDLESLGKSSGKKWSRI